MGSSSATCHSASQQTVDAAQGNIVLVGQPNVGKSVLFKELTGHYVTVSNFPGTTVEISRGASSLTPGVGVIDTPGVVSIPAQSEDEAVTTQVLLSESVRTLVQVGDGKSLRRALLLTIQLAEMGLPMVLALNMMDEAKTDGVTIDCELLAESLGIAVQPTVATRGEGVAELVAACDSARPAKRHLEYPQPIEAALKETLPLLPSGNLEPRALGLLWLSDDQTIGDWVAEHVPIPILEQLRALRESLNRRIEKPVSAAIQEARIAQADDLAFAAVSERAPAPSWSSRLTRLTTHRVWAWPILGLVMFGVYEFVGVFGAGILVGFIEEDIFGSIINPWITDLVNGLVPVAIISDFLVGEFGLWTMGMTYALALIFPIVTTFFIAFSVLEDSGYLSRLTIVSNRLFVTLGLNGKAVLPMVLGLGCVTMATLTTRILDNKRDRMLAILLLALAVPCSAQLGVILGMLGAISFSATLIWGAVLLLVLLVVGGLAARLIPGERSMLLLEMPPLRVPHFANVMVKTLARLEWYLKEVVPLFLLGTALLFVLDITGALPLMISAAEPLVTGWLGLPSAASAAFMLGFLRRDFGATGLFVMQQQHLLTPEQVVVAMVTITLFIPCLASALVIARERGMRTAVALIALIFPLACLIGGVLHRILLVTGWQG